MNAAALYPPSDRPYRVGAFGVMLVIISGLVALGTPPDDLSSTKIAYGFFMVGLDLIAGAACVRYSGWFIRAISVLVIVTVTLGPPVEFIVRSITAIH